MNTPPQKNSDELHNQLVTRLEEVSAYILACDIFQKLRNHSYSERALCQLATEYYLCFRHFGKILARAASLIEDPYIRAAVVTNVYEEHGCGKPDRCHLFVYQNFLKGLGIDVADAESVLPNPAVEHYLSGVDSIFSSQDEHFVIGYLLLTEFVTPMQYEIVKEEFKHRFQLTFKSLDFFEMHIKKDREHFASLLEQITSRPTIGIIKY